MHSELRHTLLVALWFPIKLNDMFASLMAVLHPDHWVLFVGVASGVSASVEPEWLAPLQGVVVLLKLLRLVSRPQTES